MDKKFIILGIILVGFFLFSSSNISAVSNCGPSACPGDYADQGVSCYWDGNYWTCKRTCYRAAQCGSYGGWLSSSSTRSIGVGDDDIWTSGGTDLTSTSKCYKFYSRTALTAVTDWDPGGILHLDAESVRVYTQNDLGGSASSCSGGQNLVAVDTSEQTLGRGTGITYRSEKKFIPYKSPNCGGGVAWGLEGTLVGYQYRKEASWITADYNYYYCDVPYTQTISITSPIYDGINVECDATVRGSYSDPDEIKVQWYVNDVNIVDDTCVGAGCDDSSGSTWSHTFTLAHTNFVKGDDIYCEARGYGEDGGYGNYLAGGEIEVLNSIPAWTSVALNETNAIEGIPIKITATGEADSDSDTLAMYCCDGDACTPTTTHYDFCRVTGDASPYDLFCTGVSLSGDETKTVNCRIYDGEDYSTTKSDTYVADNSGPVIVIDEPKAQNYADNDTIALDFTSTDALLDSCWYNVYNSSDEIVIANTTLAGCANITFSLIGGDVDYNLTLYSNDTLGNENIESVDFGIRTVAPAIELDYPTNNGWLNNVTNIYFNFTATDLDGLDTCELYGNWTGTWHKNYTWTGPTSGVMNYTTVNITDGDIEYKWNTWCNDSLGNNGWAFNNFTFNIDTITPNMTFDDPENESEYSTSASTYVIDLNYNTTDINLDSCFYNVTSYDPGTNNISTTMITDCSNITFTVYVPAGSSGDYYLSLCVNDSANNINCSYSQFTMTYERGESGGISPGGGGGALTPRPGINFTITNDVGGKSYIFAMSQSDTRRKPVLFQNWDIDNITITIDCVNIEGVGNERICDFVTFDKTRIIVPPSKTLFTAVDFTVVIPSDLPNGIYSFNIVGKDTPGGEDFISVEVNVGPINLLLQYFAQIRGVRYINLSFISEKAREFAVPKFIIILLANLIIFIVLNFAAMRKLEYKTPLSFLISVLGAWLVVVWFV